MLFLFMPFEAFPVEMEAENGGFNWGMNSPVCVDGMHMFLLKELDLAALAVLSMKLEDRFAIVR